MAQNLCSCERPKQLITNGGGPDSPLHNRDQIPQKVMEGSERTRHVSGGGGVHPPRSQTFINEPPNHRGVVSKHQSMNDHGNQQSPSAKQAVSHLRRTRSDHVMSSRSRENSNSRSGSPRRVGEDVFEMLQNMRKKITDNFLLGFPSPFGRRRERRPSSRSSDKDGPATLPENGAEVNGEGESPNMEEYEFVENIELNHMDGFVLGGKKEPGRGHCFQPIQLATPTWCDQCGDFIWGISKQCLKCQRKRESDMAGVEDWPPYTGVGREGGGGGGRGKRPCFTGRDRVGPEYQSYTASRSSSKAVPVARHQTSYAELLSKEEENIRKEYKSGRGVTCEYSSASELIECDGQREKTKPLSDYPARDLSYQHREKNTWSHQKKSPSQFKPSRSMEEDGHRCMPGGGSEPAMDNSSCDKTGTSPGQMEEEERLARLRELKARLSSPTESIGSSASSGQFDDAEMERRSRSRTVSSSSDSTTTSSSTPLQELVIPLPDSTDVMRAKFISMETLRSSPIPLPDPSGCFSPRSDLSEEEAFSTERNHRETTPLAGAAGYTAITESSLPSQTAAATTEAHSFRTASYVRSEEAEQQEKSKPQLGPLMSESKPNYTPGSYLANRDKYLGLSSETSTTSSMSSSKMSCSSESSSKTSSESSSKTSSKTSSESKMSTESSKGSRDNTREKRYSSSATSRIQKELDEQYRALIGDDDFDNTSTSKETRREVPSSVKTERSLPTYDELLRESLQRQSRSRDNEPRDYYSKESLVKEVLAREARERDERERGKMKSKSSGYRSEQDFSQATSDRESMSSGYSSGSPGYTLKDYKSYVASKYGEDQAAKIRESVPKPYTVRYDSPSSPLEGDTPYFVRSDSVNSDRSYTSDRTYDSGMRGDDSYGAGYYQDGRFSVNRDRYGDLYTDRDYKKSKRAHSVASDRSYSSGAHRSSGYQSEGSDSDYFYGGVPPGQESKRSYHYTSSERPRQRQYQRSSSGDSMRSEWSSSERSRPEGFPRRQRQTVLDAISVLDGPVRNLVEDLLDPREWDKNSLWDRHGSLLKDDNFCRDFFTKDWAMDDDFYGDFFKKRTTTVKQTKTEIQPGKHGEPQRFHQTTTEKRVTDDLTGIPSSTRNQYQRGSSKYAKQSRPDERQYESPTTPPSRESPRDYGRGRQNQENMFDKTRFEFGSFGAYDGERRGSQTRNRGEDAEGASKAASDVQGCKIVEEPDEKEPETVPRQEESGSQAQPVGESNTLFFRDFDDLMHRFKDLKWKDALDAYMDERKGEEVVEVKDEPKEDGGGGEEAE